MPLAKNSIIISVVIMSLCGVYATENAKVNSLIEFTGTILIDDGYLSVSTPISSVVSKIPTQRHDAEVTLWVVKNTGFMLELNTAADQPFLGLYEEFWRGEELNDNIKQICSGDELANVTIVLDRYKKLSSYELCDILYSNHYFTQNKYEKKLREIMYQYGIGIECLNDHSYGTLMAENGMIICWVAKGVAPKNNTYGIVLHGFMEGELVIDGSIIYETSEYDVDPPIMLSRVFGTTHNLDDVSSQD